MICDLKVLNELLRTWITSTNRCSWFHTFFFVILRCKSYKWLELSIESDLGWRFAIRCPNSTSGFCFLHTFFLGQVQVITKDTLLVYFVIRNFDICDLWFIFFFRLWTVLERDLHVTYQKSLSILWLLMPSSRKAKPKRSIK